MSAETPATALSFRRRLLGAVLLHADTYEEIEADRSSIWQALAVVLLASSAAVLGFWLRLLGGHALPAGSLPISLQLAVIFLEPLVLWSAGSAFAYMVGATFLRGPETETDYAEVLRTTGFAFAPALLTSLAFVPPSALGLGVLGVARLWTFVACLIAVRQALDFTTGRAVATFGFASALLWLVLWGLSVAPVPL